jgi:hypothetical protein
VEFVQDFVVESHVPRAGYYCPGEEQKYPRETRRRRRVVHTEFSAGDIYTRQVLVDWYGEQDPSQGHCTRIIRRESVVEYAREDGEQQIRATVDGVRQPKDDLWKRHRASLVYLDVQVGNGAPLREEVDVESIEQTEFGLDCAWVARTVGLSGQRGDTCMAIAPMASCAGFDMMMPIEQSANFGGDPFEGRTTSLKFGWKGSVVDKSDWMN